MKILNISNVAGAKRGGGVHEVVYNYWTVQNQIGLNSHLWFPGFEEEEIELKKISGLNKVRAMNTYLHPSFSLIKNFTRALPEMKKFNIVHQHGIWVPVSILTLEANKHYNTNVIIQPHGYLEPYRLNLSKIKKKLAYLFYEKKNIEQSRLLVACSFEEYSNLKNIFPKKDIAIIPNGVSESFYNAIANNDYFKNLKYCGRKNLLFLSRIHPLKGLERLLSAYSRIDSKIRNQWNIIIAGVDQNNHSSYLKKLAIDLKINQNVFFEGEKFNSKKVNIMSSADLFILPTYSENYGIVVAESLARGVPVLTTKGAPWGLLEKHGCGFWVDNHEDGIKLGLEKAMETPNDKLKLMGKIGRSVAKNYFLWDRIVYKTIELYSWLMGETEKPDFVFVGDDQTSNKKNIFK